MFDNVNSSTPAARSGVDPYCSNGTSPPWLDLFKRAVSWDPCARLTAARVRRRPVDDQAAALGIVATVKGAGAAQEVAAWL